jgi:multicomponent Na+:H+ antiporter subunit G
MNAALDVISAVLLLLGSAITLLGAIGIHRLDDYLSRTHAATKPATLGVVLTLTGAMLRVEGIPSVTKLVLAIAFQLFTAPVSAHLLASAARACGIPTARIVIDETVSGRPAPVEEQ